MTRVCLIGEPDSDLRTRLFEHEGSREALSAYDVRVPWQNTLEVTTVSLGAAVAFLNDIEWYLVRYTRDAIVNDSSISQTEWVSRAIATRIRDQSLDPSETASLLKVYGVTPDEALVEPMYVQRVDDHIPAYDLGDVSDTLPVRITDEEFG